MTRTLLGAEEVNLLLLGDWGADPTKSEHVKAQQRTAKVLGDWVKTLPKQPDAVLLLGTIFTVRSRVSTTRAGFDFSPRLSP